MDWWLNTIANILQILTSIGFIAGVLTWGAVFIREHNVVSALFLFVLVATLVVSALSLAQKMDWLPSKKMEIVSNRHFRDEEVVLDNKAFYSCEFEGVKFKYGGGEVFFSPDTKFSGQGGFSVTDPRAACGFR